MGAFTAFGGFIAKKAKQGNEYRKRRSEEKAAKKAEEEELANSEEGSRAGSPKHRKKKKKPGRIGKLWNRLRGKKVEEDSDSDEDDDTHRHDDEEWDGNVSGSEDDDDSEEWHGDDDEEEDYYEEDVDAFRPGDRHGAYDLEAIPRLSPDEIQELKDTMERMQPKYVAAESQILDAKLEHAVNDRLKRLRKANRFNGVIAFGAPRHIALNKGNVKVPTLISVIGHKGMGGNIGINGVYERYPDDHHGRPVYQKYLERQEWKNELQQVELHNGARGFVSQDLEDDDNWRTFPTVFDSPRSKQALKQSMVAVKVLAARPLPGAVGHFEYVHKTESWFIFFDDLLGAWCIGPKPGNKDVFARCYGVDEALPDNLGPNRWQVYDVGHRMWYTHKNLRTTKGGAVV